MKTIKDRLVSISIKSGSFKLTSKSKLRSRIEQIIKNRKASQDWTHWSASTDQWSSDRAYWSDK
jgi:hypothetical protein